MHKVAIIGAGPAGISCAIQLKRYDVDFTLFEKNEVGGYLKNANLIENFAGITDVSGSKLVQKFKTHLESLNIEVTKKEVQRLSIENDKIILDIDNKLSVFDYAVIASGTIAKTEQFGTSSKLLYEGHTLFDKEDKDIIVVGAGDAAFDYAINLAKHNRVKIFNRTTRTKSLQLLIERCKNNPNIEYFENTSILYLKDVNDKVNIKTNNTNHPLVVCDYVICAIGREPNMEFLPNDFDRFDERLLFFAGDVKNGDFRQTTIAAGDGMMCAMKIIDLIRKNK